MERGMRFETYPPMFEDYLGMVENKNYDDEVRVFVVPEEWGKKWIVNNCGSIEEFFDEWTWDDGLAMHTDAKADGVLISEWTELRDYRDYTKHA